jgi:hypothetical protein
MGHPPEKCIVIEVKPFDCFEEKMPFAKCKTI